MKTIKTTISAFLIVLAGALAGQSVQHGFDETAFLDVPEEARQASENPKTANREYTAKQKFDHAMAEASTAMIRSNYVAAVGWYEFAALNSPHSVDANFGAGLAHYLSGNLALAGAYFISALRLSPDHAESHFGLARVQIESGNHSDVCEHLSFAIAGGLEGAQALRNQYCRETQAEARGDYRGF